MYGIYDDLMKKPSIKPTGTRKEEYVHGSISRTNNLYHSFDFMTYPPNWPKHNIRLQKRTDITHIVRIKSDGGVACIRIILDLEGGETS
jgi:hypothetical protein